MEPSIALQRKYLLLLNRQYRTLLKVELVPTPSKLSDEDVAKNFQTHMIAMENYYVPKVNKTLKADLEEFKKLAPKEQKAKAPKAPKEEKAPKQPRTKKVKAAAATAAPLVIEQPLALAPMEIAPMASEPMVASVSKKPRKQAAPKKRVLKEMAVKAPKPVKVKAAKEPKPVKVKAAKAPKPVKVKAVKAPKPVKEKAAKAPRKRAVKEKSAAELYFG